MRPRQSTRSPRRIQAPPRNFSPATGVEWVRHSAVPPPFVRPRRVKGRRAEGERYERKVQKELELNYGDEYVPGPWFEFKVLGEERTRWCQPDGLLFQPVYSTITIVEIKLQHTADAWWQVKQLYLPVVGAAFPADLWRFSFCEVVRWHDPDVQFPEHYRLVGDILAVGLNQFGVHIMNPTR